MKFINARLRTFKSVKYICMPCFIVALFCLIAGFILLAFNYDEKGALLILVSVFFIGASLAILSSAVLFFNSKTYRINKKSFGLNKYGSTELNEGYGYFIFNQVIALSYALTGYGLVIFMLFIAYKIYVGEFNF